MSAISVRIRMYNPGFGDCFLVTVREGDAVWRLLVDCGVHSHGRFKVDGRSRKIEEVVDAVIAQLRDEAPDGIPRLNAVVATHHHADHIAGFAADAWDGVEVGEVWLPFVENADDPDTRRLKVDPDEVATRLQGLVRHALDGRPSSAKLSLAMAFAANSSRNAVAGDRLRTGRFANRGEVQVRFLPSTSPDENVLALPIDDVRVHVLGPGRDPAQIKKMNPPKNARWLDDADVEATPGTDRAELFDEIYHVPRDEVPSRISNQAFRTMSSMRLNSLAFDEDALLAAASVLERSVNNTSLFFVLDVRGARFVFVGDSQYGAWMHVLDDPAARALVSDATFYKVGHHGSHNATPREFIDTVLGGRATAMMPVGHVAAWADSIPYPELIGALGAQHAHLIRSDAPPAADPLVLVDADSMWTEIAFRVDEAGQPSAAQPGSPQTG